jgi:exodeoxyribonuclease V beta subunit
LQLQSYDNLLLSLAQALDGAHGERLAATLRGRYSAALIDEFQDTDPVQYGIFSTIYRGTEYPVFMVGDPKQAIYSFRGADVFAYIDARRHSQRCFTLNRNWRSAPLLVDAVNHLFREAGMRAFVLDEIPFRPVQAAQIPDRETLGEGNDRAPFRFWFLPAGESGKPLSKGAAVPRVADMVANEIARLLSMGSMGQARIGRRAVEGGDIAVLVRDHRQGWAVRQALSSLGISSVQQMQDSVFHTREAEQLERVLLAVAEPHRASRVRSALATDLLGLDGSDILSLAADEEAWADWLDRFRAYRQQWLDRGFARMMRQLIIESGLRARLLRYADGERRLTNVSQLVELLQAESLTSSGSMDSLLRWLADQRTGWQGKEEVSQLRLESDEQLVKIVTIHKSKGLEYPIVFCPFLWDGRLRIPTESAFSFHDPGRAFQAVLDLGSPGHEAARALAIQEEMAENLRLLYVALTRARHRCYVLWGNLASAGQSALGWLLHPPPDVSPGWFDQMDGSFSAWGDGALLARLEQLVSTSEGSMRIEPVPEPEAPSQGSSQKAPGEFRCRHFGREFGAAPRVLSFSSLNNALDRPERPDHDAVFDTEPVSVAVERPDTIFSFPRGARAGSCLHWIFEQIDFRPADGAQIADYCERGLAAHGLDAEWLPVVVDTVLRVLATPLDEPGRITLSQVSRQRRMVELEFHFPLATLEPRNLADRIARDVTGHRHAQSMVASMRRLDFGQVRGFMTGFIDLVFEHGGRYYLADYKSNWLGDQRSDYAAPSLVQSMEQHGYYLQYLIYSVALHRYLAHRLPDYAYQRHFGGVFYLFLRGMDPGADGDYGIYRDRPSESLIQTLDRMMMEGSC